MLRDGLICDALNAAMQAERAGDTEAATRWIDRAVERALLAKPRPQLPNQIQEECQETGNSSFSLSA